MADHISVWPIMTTSSTRKSSNANWSWRSLPRRTPGSSDTLPAEGSRSPPMIFMNVDLPDPLAPISP